MKHDSSAEQLKRHPTPPKGTVRPDFLRARLLYDPALRERITDDEARAITCDVREKIGECLAGPPAARSPKRTTAFDLYMTETGQYDAITLLWSKISRQIAVVSNAENILDLTCATGEIAMRIADMSDHAITIHASEYSEDLFHVAKRRIERWKKKEERDDKKILMTEARVPLDESQTTVRQPAMDVVLWWGSFNMTRGRGHIMTEAFDRLKPGGAFIIMDAYPWAPIPEGYVGKAGHTRIATLSRPLDMAEDVESRVKKQWAKRIDEDMGAVAAAETPIQVITMREMLHLPIGLDNKTTHVTCLCFIKPRF